MTNLPFSDYGNTPFEKLLGHNPNILEHWRNLEKSVFQEVSLDAHLLEQVRRTLAYENECEYCMAKAGKPIFNSSEMQIGVATAFAELFAKSHKEIQNSHFEILRNHFSITQISELCAFISFISASQCLGKIFNLTKEYQQKI